MKERTIIKGDIALAAELGVSTRTIRTYKKEGILAKAIISNYRRFIAYDLDMVYECLNHR